MRGLRRELTQCAIDRLEVCTAIVTGENLFLLRIESIKTLGIDAIGNHAHMPFRAIDHLPMLAEIGREIAMFGVARKPQHAAGICCDSNAAATDAVHVDRLAGKGSPMVAAIGGIRCANGWTGWLG